MAQVDNLASATQENATAAGAFSTEWGLKVLTFTERNFSTACQFGQRILKAKDLSEAFRLQSEYLNKQMQVWTEQVKELNEMTLRAMERSKPKSER